MGDPPPAESNALPFQIGERVYGNYQGTWLPAKYDGQSDRPGLLALVYDQFPRCLVRTKKEHIRRLDEWSAYDAFMIKTQSEIQRIQRSYRKNINALERD